MSSNVLLGSAAIAYTPSGGYEVTHALAAPLRILKYAKGPEAWEHDSLDYSVVERRALSSEAYEIEALLSFEDDPEGMQDMLETAADTGAVLTYYPDSDIPALYYTVELVDYDDRISVTRDRQMGNLRRWETSVRLLHAGGPPLYELIMARTEAGLILTDDDHWALDFSSSPDGFVVLDGTTQVIDDTVTAGRALQLIGPRIIIHE